MAADRKKLRYLFKFTEEIAIFVTDIAHLDQIHRVRAEYFTPPYPASTLVEVSRLVRPEYLIEIDAVASIPYERMQEPAP